VRLGDVMEETDTGKDKVRKICEILRKETLEPAMEESERILSEARNRAVDVIKQAENKAAKILAEADEEVERRKAVFHASLQQGARQTLEALKQEIEQKLLSKNLSQLLTTKLNEPDVLASLIKAVLAAIREQGLGGDISAVIPSHVPARAVNELLGKEFVEQLKEKSVLVGPLKAGVEIKLLKDKVTIDLTETALKEMVSQYIRKDLRTFLFS